MRRRPILTLYGLLICISFRVALGDDFDRLEGQALSGVPENKAATQHRSLTFTELGNLPSVLRGGRSALLVVVSDQGNPARLLVSPALRKQPGGKGEPLPVLVLERFATFEAGKATTRLARGQDLILFDGFRVDLDLGQVVPEGQGGDLQFLAGGPEGPRLVALDGSKLFTLSASPLPPATQAAGPSPGRAVLPTDFSGRFRLFANGQWSGTLDLTVDDQGVVSGQFRSDLNGAFFPVTGQVAADVPQKIRFTVTYPRTRQDFEGFLWTEGKGALAGSVVMQEHPYGFFAIREGGRYAPEGEGLGPLTGEERASGRSTGKRPTRD